MLKHTEEYVFELIAQSLSSGGGVSLEKLRETLDSVCVCVLKFSSNGQRYSQRSVG